MTKAGVYAITNMVTGEQYIGGSHDIDKRFYHHRYTLRTNQHMAPKLQRAWNHQGSGTFTFTVLELVADAGKVAITEQKYIDTLHPEYNRRAIARIPERSKIKKVNATFSLTEVALQLLTALADANGVTYSAQLEMLIRAGYKAWKKEERTREKISAAS